MGTVKQSVFPQRDFWGGQKAKSKLAFGTMKFESAASDFPPEGPKKESYVERDTFKKLRIGPRDHCWGLIPGG